MTQAKLEALDTFEGKVSFTELQQLVLRHAVEMTRTPVDVRNDTFDRLKQHFDSRQLVELTSCIAWENYRARFDHAFGYNAEGFSEGAYCPATSAPRTKAQA